MHGIIRKGGSILKKVLIVIVVYSFIIAAFTKLSDRDAEFNHTAFVESNRTQLYALIEDPKFQETQEGKVMASSIRAFSCSFVGEACTDNPEDGYKNFSKSFVGSAAQFVAYPIANPPASGVYWAINGIQQAGFVPDAYAAEGLGFSALRPLIKVWTIFRDAAYMLLVLVLIAIGFMIMFRMKINAQTVIAVENSLPRIVISLLLITFSFPIAGFMIDLMYVIMAVSISLLAGNPADPFYNVGEYQNKFLTAGPNMIIEQQFLFVDRDVNNPWVQAWLNFVEGAPLLALPGSIMNGLFKLGNVAMSILLIFPGIVQLFIYALSGYAIVVMMHRFSDIFDKLTLSLGDLGAFTFSIGGLLRGGFNMVFVVAGIIILALISVPLIMMLMILATVFLLFFRVFFLLLTGYLKILFLVIFSPLFMLAEAIPGREAFGWWIKSLFGELSTFPLVVILLLIGNIITNEMIEGQAVWGNEGSFTQFTPIASNTFGNGFWAPPFLYGINQEAFAFLCGMGIIFLIPDLIKLYKKTLGLDSLPINVGLGTFFAGGTTAATSGIGLLKQASAVQGALVGEHRGVLKPLQGMFKGVFGSK